MLKYRLFSGISLIAVFSLLIFWNSIVSSILFLLVGCFILSVAIIEFFSLTRKLGYLGYPIHTITAAVCQFLIIGVDSMIGVYGEDYGHVLENMVIFIFIVILFIRVFLQSDLDQGIKNLIVSLGAFLYLSWSLSFMARIYFLRDGLEDHVGPLMLFYLIIVTKFADIGGYFGGKLSAGRSGGNHKLAPRLSPKKSWEGLIGGIILSVGASYLLVYILGEKIVSCGGAAWLTNSNAGFLAISFSILGLLGDLSVSSLKRAAKQKDTGMIIPGFGGILDLVDSLILVSPFYYCFVRFSSLETWINSY